MKYQKLPITISQQIDLLKSRGLKISNEDSAIKYLSTIGYYRLSGYMYHFQLADGSHKFKPDISFNDIIDTYNFDKKLRYLFAAYLEQIEVAMRALLTNSYANTYGFFWYTNPIHYTKIPVPGKIKESIAKGKIRLPRKYFDTHQYINKAIDASFAKATELFITKFKSNYGTERRPPANMAMEILSMGKISRMFEALKNAPEKQQIANRFKLPHHLLSSWLIYLTNIRNICAHHARLWNRKTSADRFIIPSKSSLKFNGEIQENFNISLYGSFSVLSRLLNVINPENNLEKNFKQLLSEFPKINITYMGFPADWEQSPAWLWKDHAKTPDSLKN